MARDRNLIERLSVLFERIGAWSYDHRWLVLAACAAVVATSTVLAGRARIDNSFEAYFAHEDAAYQAYLQFRDDFGSDEIAYIMYGAPDHEHGPFNLEIMRTIQKLTEALEDDIPFVQEVTSLSNVEYVEGVPDGLEIYDLLEDFPESQEALLDVRKKVLAKPLYLNTLVSRDARFAAITIETEASMVDPIEQIRLDPNGGDGLPNLYPQATYNVIHEILARPEYETLTFYHTGDVAMNAVYNQTIDTEGNRLGLLAFLVIGGLLLFFFRRPIDVVGPLVVVAVSIVIAAGLVGLLGWRMDMMFMMIGPLLIAVGVADAVHIVSEFRAYYARLGDRREAARRTMYLVGTPCLLTSATTAAGFASMSISPIKAISHFAVYSAAGVVAAFLLSVTLLMVFLSLGRRRPREGRQQREMTEAKGGRWMQAFLHGVCSFDIRYRKPILWFFGVLFLLSLAGLAQLRVDSNFMNEFGDSIPVKQATDFVDETMGGTGSFIYLFDAGEPDGIKDPTLLREVERVQQKALEQDYVVMKSHSIIDILKDINQAFHGGDPAFYVLPETRELVAQYLLFYEMSGGEEAEEYVSSDYGRASLELRTRMAETSVFRRMDEAIDAHLAAAPIQTAELHKTGMGALWLILDNYITQSQIRGFLLAFTVIAMMMCFIFQSVRIGLISMIPNLAPVFLTLGAMGWLGMPLDYIRLLIGTIAIGIAVDDTIHHVTRYMHEYRSCGDYEQALYRSMNDVGRALVITSIVLATGFLMFVPSIMQTFVTFGLLVTATVVMALVADFLLMPALVLTLKPFGAPPGRPAAGSGAAEPR